MSSRSLFLSLSLSSRLFAIREHVGHVWKRYGSCRMRQAGNLSQLRRREHRYQHRRNTAAVSVSEYYLRAVLHSSEILDRAARSATQVRIDGAQKYINSRALSISQARVWVSRFQGSSVRADRGLSIQAEYDQLVSSELHSRPVELSARCLSLPVSIKLIGARV